MSDKPKVHLTLKECEYCKEALRIVEHDHERAELEVASGRQHVCWQNLPSDANLVVMEE